MTRLHEGPHLAEGPTDCFGCKIQSVNFDPRAMPSRRNSIAPKVLAPRNNWERGIPTDNRGMPMLKSDLTPMGVKEVAERHHQIDNARRFWHNAPAEATTNVDRPNT